MYRNIVWFVVGYITCKEIVPIVNQVIVKTNQKLKEKEAS